MQLVNHEREYARITTVFTFYCADFLSFKENVCAEIENVTPANYNCPGQLVISGSIAGIDAACEKLTALGARRALKLAVSGAFHSPFMEPARQELAKAINETAFAQPICPVYQNVTAKAEKPRRTTHRSREMDTICAKHDCRRSRQFH